MKQGNKFNLVGLLVAIAGTVLFVFTLNTSPGEGVAQFAAVQTSSAVQIPQALVLAFNALLFTVLTAGFTYIISKIGLDLTSFATPLAATLSTFLLGLAQNWIDLQPISSDPLLLMILNVLVVIVGGLGTLFIVRKRDSATLIG